MVVTVSVSTASDGGNDYRSQTLQTSFRACSTRSVDYFYTWIDEQYSTVAEDEPARSPYRLWLSVVVVPRM